MLWPGITELDKLTVFIPLQALMQQGMDKRQIEFTKLEGALSEMQYEYRKKNRFRQLALLVIARLMPKNELDGMDKLFAALDVDHDQLRSTAESVVQLIVVGEMIDAVLVRCSPST